MTLNAFKQVRERLNADDLAFEGSHRVVNSTEAVAGISPGVVFSDAMFRHFGTSGLLRFLAFDTAYHHHLSGILRARRS
jgi:hypothetical protein